MHPFFSSLFRTLLIAIYACATKIMSSFCDRVTKHCSVCSEIPFIDSSLVTSTDGFKCRGTLQTQGELRPVDSFIPDRTRAFLGWTAACGASDSRQTHKTVFVAIHEIDRCGSATGCRRPAAGERTYACACMFAFGSEHVCGAASIVCVSLVTSVTSRSHPPPPSCRRLRCTA